MVSVLNLTIHLDKEEAGNERLFFKDSGESHLDTNVQLQHNVNFCYEENIKAKVKKMLVYLICSENTERYFKKLKEE